MLVSYRRGEEFPLGAGSLSHGSCVIESKKAVLLLLFDATGKIAPQGRREGFGRGGRIGGADQCIGPISQRRGKGGPSFLSNDSLHADPIGADAGDQIAAHLQIADKAAALPQGNEIAHRVGFLIDGGAEGDGGTVQMLDEHVADGDVGERFGWHWGTFLF